MIDEMTQYRIRRFTQSQKSLLLKMIKESQRSDLEDNIKDILKDILKDIDVSYSTGITKKASRKEEMIACREVHYIFSILTKRGINNDYRNEIWNET